MKVSPTRFPSLVGAVAGITVLLGLNSGNGCDAARNDKPPVSTVITDTGWADPDKCDDQECTPATEADWQHLKCDECGDNTYDASRCPLRCEPCEDDEYFWVYNGLPCHCVGADGINNHEEGCDPP